jgi:hypothetical protein
MSKGFQNIFIWVAAVACISACGANSIKQKEHLDDVQTLKSIKNELSKINDD